MLRWDRKKRCKKRFDCALRWKSGSVFILENEEKCYLKAVEERTKRFIMALDFSSAIILYRLIRLNDTLFLEGRSTKNPEKPIKPFEIFLTYSFIIPVRDYGKIVITSSSI